MNENDMMYRTKKLLLQALRDDDFVKLLSQIFQDHLDRETEITGVKYQLSYVDMLFQFFVTAYELEDANIPEPFRHITNFISSAIVSSVSYILKGKDIYEYMTPESYRELYNDLCTMDPELMKAFATTNVEKILADGVISLLILDTGEKTHKVKSAICFM